MPTVPPSIAIRRHISTLAGDLLDLRRALDGVELVTRASVGRHAPC